MISKNRLIQFAWANVLLSLAAAALAAKPAPPSAAELKEAAASINEVFKADFTAARAPDQRLALAKKLLAAGKEEKDPAGKYALLIRAKEIATDSGEFSLAFEVIDELDRNYELSAAKLKTEAAAASAKTVRTSEQRRSFLLTALSAITTALAAEDFDSAKSISAAEVSVARASSDLAVMKDASNHSLMIRDFELAFLDSRKALATLETTPKDPAANFLLGKYLCYYKEQWDNGLPALSLGNNAPAKKAADDETKGAASQEEKTKLGDQWWDIATPLTGLAKIHVQEHAAKWYQGAATEGLAKARIDARLKELHDTLNPPLPLLPEEKLFLGQWLVGAGNGQPDFITTLHPDYTATNTRDTSTTGTWAVVNGVLQIKWDNGWSDQISRKGNSWIKEAFSPNTPFTSSPQNTTGAQKK